ncbi:apoptosis regulator BAX-like [Mercenaria mercenaria]|uniref:apoptosis regulator BAX-like n=1 Tax=Mercenaria mercenaria TaxID=6596 RepID=UPI00234F21BE|nr:apoptosis regulator BAX-like [Mercenaria mercenaria]
MFSNKNILYHGIMAAVAPSERDYPVGYVPRENRRTRLRRISEHLTRLDMPNDNHRNPFFDNILTAPKVSAEETREEGKVLFGQFIYDEINREEDLETPEEIREEIDHLCTPQGYANPAWAKVGQDLRRCADDFQRSKERKKVRRQAAEITQNSSGVTKNQFRDLLSELLKNGITKERIIVLFFFCSDVAIETLKRKAQTSVQLCQQFIQWSFEFIAESVCSWVQANGGWGAVFNSTMVFVGRAVLVFGVGMICYYGYKKFIKS